MTDRRTVFLEEMGLGPVWSQRTVSAHTVEVQQDHEPLPEVTSPVVKNVRTAEASSAWSDSPVRSAAPAVSVNQVAATTGDDIAQMDWEQLKSVVSTCTKCDLCRTRTQTVFGVGDQKARWLFVGGGPGRNEDFQGLPFVGPAGKLLDNMLIAMGMKRGENTYIANIVKCRPTDASKKDRPPAAEEAAACMPYLERQIALINPTIIIALGKTAALSLLKLDPATPVGKLRGTVHRYADRPLIVTYHPAYLLRSLKDKSKVWADLCLAMQTYGANEPE
ncbi:MAG TPA: uracil-DNA glycosylase [Herminiimonas sp.]|nr:uracil-DNA glycosylase [Herminiimonas sp.]